MPNFFDAKDILKLFKKTDKELNDLWCALETCCSKIPINIGDGEGLFKQLKHNKWEFKSILAGDNISISEQDNTITISGSVTPITCLDIDNCLGISDLGDPDKYLNQQGDWQTITIPPNFITGILDTNTIDLSVVAGILHAEVNYQNTATINLSEDASGLKADFASMLISQFTNNSGYITSTGASLTDTYVGYGSGVNTLTGNSSFIYNASTGYFKAGFAGSGDFIDINSVTNTIRGIASDGVNTSQVTLDDINGVEFYVTNGGTSSSIDLNPNSLYFSVDNIQSLSFFANIYNIGDVGGVNNGTKIEIDDSGLALSILLNATNGVIVSNLSGISNRMVIATSVGLLSTQAIPSNYILSVSDTSSIDLDVTIGNLTATLILVDGGTF